MRAKAFFKTRFAIRPRDEAEGDHWLGGKGEYKNAVCACGEQLYLLADFNLNDPVLRKASRGKFGDVPRLPLFHCCKCWCELSYRVDSKRKVSVLQTRHAIANLTPQYENYPSEFPRRAIYLDGEVPKEVKKALDRWNPERDPFGDRLNMGDRLVVERFIGHPISLMRFLYHHQLGGEALGVNWDETAFQCANPQCPGGVVDKLLRRGRPMRFLAGIFNDPRSGFPLIEPLNASTATKWNDFVTVFYQICDKCLSITTFSASD